MASRPTCYGTVNLLCAAPPGTRFVFASSGAVYKPDDKPHTEDDATLGPSDVYGYTKLHGENFVKYFAAQRGLGAVIVRLFNVVGPGRNQSPSAAGDHRPAESRAHHLAARQHVAEARLHPRTRCGSGFITVALRDDVAAGNTLTVNLGTSHSYSVAELVDKLKAVAKIDFSLEQEQSRLRAVDRPHLAADISRIASRFGWAPQSTHRRCLGGRVERTRSDAGAGAEVPLMRVFSTIVVPPHMSVSGGARAGELLSDALAQHCEMTVASMMNGGGMIDRRAGCCQIPVRSWLPPIVPWSRLSNRYSTLFYRSDLPQIVRNGRFRSRPHSQPYAGARNGARGTAAIRRGIPYVVSTHGFNEVANGGKIYGFDAARRLVWKTLVEGPVSRVVARASGIFAFRQQISTSSGHGNSGPELTIVTNGVPMPESVSAGVRRLSSGRASAFLGQRNAGQITCMFLANHTPNKGLPVLLEAFARWSGPSA